MRHLVRNSIILLVATLLGIWAIVPPGEKLRRGKDLAGGASLVYAVYTKPGEPDVMDRVVTVIKERIDPKGVMEIAVVAQGADRIEITMPLPSDRVKALKAEYEKTLEIFGDSGIGREAIERAVALPPESREAQLTKLAGTDTAKLDRLSVAAATYDGLQDARRALAEAQKEVDRVAKQIKELEAAGETDSPLLQGLRAALDVARGSVRTAVEATATADIAYEQARDAAVTTGMEPAEVRRALLLSDRELRLTSSDGKTVKSLASPRQRALEDLRAAHPEQVGQLETAIKAWNTYEQDRRTLDDPADLVRLLRGAGVLNFRITVNPGELPNEAEARQQLRANGPRGARVEDARWFKINKLESWVDDVDDLAAVEADPAGYFAARGYVADEYRGEHFMLAWDKRGMRLTEDDGEWTLANSYQDQDEFGRQAIAFQMDRLGAGKLGALTEPNINRRMAVLLDDEVYTAPNLQSRIAGSGRITGNFSQTELDYITRVLSAGSLRAKLSSEPISQSVLGPELGADNLRRGLVAGVISFVLVAGFMIGYYFSSGLIAVIGLLFNVLFLLALMSINHAAFTLPGIAGVILAFGMAVDANVLIYERMREELQRGNDLRTSVRLAYHRALAPIVDGNLTHLITCIVLGFTGTQEIKGFAVTMSIGVITTLFCQLFITRLLYTFMVERVGVRRISMLPMAVPAVQRAMTLRFDWLGKTPFFFGLSAILVVGSLALIASQGRNLMDTEFRGGTKVTIQLKVDPATGEPMLMPRSKVEDDIRALAAAPGATDQTKALAQADVLAVNPESDGIHSSRFTIKTSVTDTKFVSDAVSQVFAGVLDQQEALTFRGSDLAGGAQIPVYPVTAANLGDNIDQPGVNQDVSDFLGGEAIVLQDLGPNPPTQQQIDDRLKAMATDPLFAASLNREYRVYPLQEAGGGEGGALRSAVVLVRDPAISYLDSPARWADQLRGEEWSLVTAALGRSTTAAAVQSFSPQVAQSFTAQAITAILLSSVLIIIYVSVRFNSVRYAFAAILATLHDCVIAVGAIALASVIGESQGLSGVASTLGILPFKIDLNVIAAVLTILGYSLNDKIVVMDRIRENRGKLPYASRQLVNDSINQTFSRTIMTGTTTFLASIVLYVWGGEAIRSFAYCFIIGIAVGTYSSIAIAAPLVASRRTPPANDPPRRLAGLPAAAAV